MLSRYVVFACILFLCSALTACDSMEKTEDMLTEQEANTLLKFFATGLQGADTISTLGGAITNTEPPDADGPPANGDFSIPIDTTYACSGGGSASLGGKVAPDLSRPDDGITLRYDFSRFATDCMITVDNVTFELDMYYGVREEGVFSLEVLESDEELAFLFDRDGATKGTLVWATAGRSGSCEVDLTSDEQIKLTLFSVNLDPNNPPEPEDFISIEGGTSGRICDISVAYTPEAEDLAELAMEPEDALSSRIVAGKRRVQR